MPAFGPDLLTTKVIIQTIRGSDHEIGGVGFLVPKFDLCE